MQLHRDRPWAKALDELAKGDDELAKGKPENAVEHYRNAWQQATK
jgi:hypothetical protein